MNTIIYDKCIKVIESCKTKKQMRVASAYIDTALTNRYIDFDLWDELADKLFDMQVA